MHIFFTTSEIFFIEQPSPLPSSPSALKTCVSITQTYKCTHSARHIKHKAPCVLAYQTLVNGKCGNIGSKTIVAKEGKYKNCVKEEEVKLVGCAKGRVEKGKEEDRADKEQQQKNIKDRKLGAWESLHIQLLLYRRDQTLRH
jgi:hypothetical protein